MNELIERIRLIVGAERPVVIGIGGPVAVGKTTISTVVAEVFDAQVISTDAFLFDNATLAARDLSMRKGFPETYDADAIDRAFTAIRSGKRVDLPVYSHETYDIVPGATERVGGEVVVVEGIVALQEPLRAHLDVAVYVDADEALVRGWFIERFLRWTADARATPDSFYAGFAALDDPTVRNIAEMTWDAINGPNLTEHIGPSMATADIIVTKGPGHRIESVT